MSDQSEQTNNVKSALPTGEELSLHAGLWRDAWRRLRANKLAVFGAAVILIMIVASLLGPIIIKAKTGYTYDYIPKNTSLIRAMPPSLVHPMGTDNLGRDMLARVLFGGRISLMVG